MCGIVGVVSAGTVDRRAVMSMRDELIHRGPDAAGLWASEDGRVCLGHRRLAIVDLSPDANQPFVSGDGRLAITFNGEIYNFRDLRSELEREGAVFRTHSDTEVLLAAYSRWGERCLDRVSGMFAFAIWDAERGRLFCARDRVGEKPFYYASVGESFVFASELKSLVGWPGFRKRLDYVALADFLTFGFVPDPQSIWQGARKLAPGHSLTVDLHAEGPCPGEPQAYWDFVLDADGSGPDWGSEIREALELAAAEMAYADVPVGSFLSGGVDSSAVTAALSRAGLPVESFTVGFADADYDERAFAREAAAICGTPHTERVVSADDVEPVFREVVLRHFDEPFNDYSYLPTYYLCREARRTITVALTGDGGDELFAGYGKYRLLARRESLDRTLSRPVTRLVAAGARTVTRSPVLNRRLLPYEQTGEDLLLATLTTGIDQATLRRVARGPLAEAVADHHAMDTIRPHLLRAPTQEHGLVNSMRYLDLKLTLGAGILTKVDRTSMAVSLETRPVLLNRRVLEVAARIPSALLADRLEAKKILRASLRDWLPPSLLDRPKQGFAMPLGRWLRGDLRSFASSSRGGRVAELLDPSYARSIAEAQLAGDQHETGRLHSLLFLENWLEQWA
jgi:asparagine synthase (glutamine-hydrolysing)